MNLRWLPHAEGEAAWNMAVDEAILECHLHGSAPTTLRFYGWAPPAVSIGYAQRIDPQVVSYIISRGFSVVRRPTGGRAVLHQGDLTYSYIGSSIEQGGTTGSSSTASNLALLAPGVSKSYLQICEGLIEGLKRLGIEAEIGRGKGGYNRFQDCFQSTTSADLQVNGLKVVGSAQLRRKHAVLQHGSILLNQDQLLMPQLLSGSASGQVKSNHLDLKQSHPAQGVSDQANPEQANPEQANPEQANPEQANPEQANPRHCNVFELIGVLPIKQIEQAFLEGFCQINGQRFEQGALTGLEIELAKTLLPKYSVAG